jgi:hypothetical protein
MVSRDEIINKALEMPEGRVWSISVGELVAAFPPDVTGGVSPLDYLNNILASQNGPTGHLVGATIVFKRPGN